MRSKNPTTRLLATTLILLTVLPACSTGSGSRGAPPELSARQRESMQTRILDGNYDHVYSAVLSILQDEGWKLEHVDKNAGVVQASSLKYQDEVGPREDHLRNDRKFQKMLEEQREKSQPPVWTRWQELTAHVEPWGPGRTRVRISIVKLGSSSA